MGEVVDVGQVRGRKGNNPLRISAAAVEVDFSCLGSMTSRWCLSTWRLDSDSPTSSRRGSKPEGPPRT